MARGVKSKMVAAGLAIAAAVAVATVAATSEAAQAQPATGTLASPARGTAALPAVPAPTMEPVTRGPAAIPTSPWLDPQLNAGASAAQIPETPAPQSYVAAPVNMPQAAQPVADADGPVLGGSGAGQGSLNRIAPPAAKAIAGYVEPGVQGPDQPSVGSIPTGSLNAQIPSSVSGIAPPMGPAELEEALSSRTGPALPDAQLAGHLSQAVREADLKLKAALLDLQALVNTKTLTALDQERKIRIALEMARLPIPVNSEGEIKRGTQQTAAAAPQQPTMAAEPPPVRSVRLNEATIAGTEPRVTMGTDDLPDPVPVVYSLGGVNGNRTADVLIPYGGSQEVAPGSMLPHGLKVVAINAHSVIVEGPDGRRRSLPMGRSAPGTPPVRTQSNQRVESIAQGTYVGPPHPAGQAPLALSPPGLAQPGMVQPGMVQPGDGQPPMTPPGAGQGWMVR